MYVRLRVIVIFSLGRVVQGRKLLSKEPIKLRFKTKTKVDRPCFAEHFAGLNYAAKRKNNGHS